MHATAASAGKQHCEPTAVQRNSNSNSVNHHLAGRKSAEKSAAAKADGRMKRLKRAAQEAQPEEGWWRARGEHRGWKNNDA
jgi:hypothetical protein